MKRLWIIGESLPLRPDGTARAARKFANLPETLIPLDPRHGVFPNLVTKPLFAAGFSLSKHHGNKLHTFFREMAVVVKNMSERRFNVFKDRPTKSKKQSGENEANNVLDPNIFEIDDDELTGRVNRFDRNKDLWLMFGHQTTFGFLCWLLGDRRPFRVHKEDINEFSKRFVSTVGQTSPEFACGTRSQRSRRTGLLHRLCTGLDTSAILEQVVSKSNPKSFPIDQIVELLRSTVPLLHNEAYQDGSNPIGNAQNHFVQQAKGKNAEDGLYWQVMGDAIATRILGGFVA